MLWLLVSLVCAIMALSVLWISGSVAAPVAFAGFTITSGCAFALYRLSK